MDGQKQEITKAVADRIKFFRHVRLMSQEDLALCANINPAYFGQVERGLKCPTIDTLCKIAGALEVSPAELLRIDAPLFAPGNHEKRIKELLSQIPDGKVEQVCKIIENILALME